MPLHATIRINETPIKTITVARLERLRAKDRWYNYVCTTTDDDGTVVTAQFQHQYSQGAEECLRRALEALATAREVRTNRR